MMVQVNSSRFIWAFSNEISNGSLRENAQGVSEIESQTEEECSPLTRSYKGMPLQLPTGGGELDRDSRNESDDVSKTGLMTSWMERQDQRPGLSRGHQLYWLTHCTRYFPDRIKHRSYKAV